MATEMVTLDEPEERVHYDDDSLACLDPGFQLCRRRSSVDKSNLKRTSFVEPAMPDDLASIPDELYECWDETPNIQPNASRVEEMVDQILAGVRGKISDVSTGISDLRKRTSTLLTDYAYLQKDVTDVSSLCKELDAVAAKRVQNLDEVIYLNGLIKHLEDVDKEMMLVPCEFTETMVAQSHNFNKATGDRDVATSPCNAHASKSAGFMM